ncbi:MAG: ABC transporter permease [Muribaculaceae bacterium]|nr:ABC transporter permease [Muribaculaceae bacterium]MDE5958463.1 ABC transporter permease [Muribaculaceae bacterium]MDE6447796.1 ABC transporter permease [Muribaculaceae bacterium]
MIVSSIKSFGRYCMFMTQVFRIPDKWRVFFSNLLFEINKLGVDSIPLVLIISLFIGAVICIQMTINIVSPIIPSYSTGLATREILLLEFSSTMMCLILAGKVGSNIASEIGTMRVTEQIDAMDIMGINSANYIVLPKIIGFVLFVPVLCVFSMFFGLVGGWFIAEFTNMLTVETYVFGIQSFFTEWYVWYGIIKTLVFAYLITSIAAYYGYYVKGGALEVGKASTNAVVSSSILILLADVILTKLLLE